MQSFRSKNGLEAYVTFPSKYTAFPGILNGGLVGTAFECGGNWTAGMLITRTPPPPLPTPEGPVFLCPSIQLDKTVRRPMLAKPGYSIPVSRVSGLLYVTHGFLHDRASHRPAPGRDSCISTLLAAGNQCSYHVAILINLDASWDCLAR